MADPNALFHDKRFSLLPVEDQMTLLGEMDHRFSKITPEQYVKLKLDIMYPQTAETPGKGFWGTLGDVGPKIMDYITGGGSAGVPGIIQDIKDPNRHYRELQQQGNAQYKQGEPVSGFGTKLASLIPGYGDEALAAGNEFGAGNIGGGSAHALLSLLPFAARNIPDVPPNALPNLKRVAINTGRGVKAGVGGGIEAFADGKASIPSAAGAVIGETLGGHKGAAIGSAVGALPGTIKGITKGVQGAEYLPMLRAPVSRTPLWEGATTGGGVQPSTPVVPLQPPMGMDAEGNMRATLPSGRQVGPAPVQQRVEPMPQPQTGLPPIDKFEMNRMAHARAQEMELPGSPSGKSGHAALSQAAKDIYGVKSWSDMNVEQMRAVHDFLEKNKRLPVKGEIK